MLSCAFRFWQIRQADTVDHALASAFVFKTSMDMLHGGWRNGTILVLLFGTGYALLCCFAAFMGRPMEWCICALRLSVN